MQEYIVIWRGGGAEFIHSAVNAEDSSTLSPDDWVRLASEAEGDESDITDAILDNGYDLIAVLRSPVHYII